MAHNTLGRNLTFSIYNADGTSFHNLVLHKAVVDSVVMSLGDKITGDVYYKDNTLAVTMQEYIKFKKNPDDENEDEVMYMLVNKPTIVREGMANDNSELKGMTKYSFEFYHPMYLLNNIPFSDVAVNVYEERYLSQNKTFNWIGTLTEFIAKLNANLEGTQWVVVASDSIPQSKLSEMSQVLTFDKQFISDALKKQYETWEQPFVIDTVGSAETQYSQGKRFKVVIGLPSNEIYASEQDRQNSNPFVFQMGKGVGLKNNSRTPRNNKIITRISGYGSEQNIPYGYPQIVWTGDQTWNYTINNQSGMQTVVIGGVSMQAMSYPIYDGIVGGQSVKLIKHPFTRTTLMPSIYTETVDKKVNPRNANYNPQINIIDYYDAIYSQQYPYTNEINLSAPSYEIHEFDVKPEMNNSGSAVAILGATPLNPDLTPSDHWDDSIDDDGNFIQSYFQVNLPILSFDLYACSAITEEMQINMRSGMCLGCTFPVQVDWEDYKKNFYRADGTFDPVIHTTDGDGHVRDGSKYPNSSVQAISIIVQKENQTFGTIMPNVYQTPQSGDEFVILGISLPTSYITNAESRLDDEMKSYMLTNNSYYFDYPLKFDEYFLATHTNILQQIKPNAIIRFLFGDSQTPLELYVKQLTIKYGQSPLPQYDITLTDDIEVVLNQIGQVADDVSKLSSIISAMRENYSRNVWSELAKKLSKVSDDTANGWITFGKGLNIGNYAPDSTGGRAWVDTNQASHIEIDYLTVRRAAMFREITIKELKHIGGELALTPAAEKCAYVEYINALGQVTTNLGDAVKFRCYFEATDGDGNSITNDFIVNDQVRCQKFDLQSASNGYTSTKYYWRLVTGVGTSGNYHYIDLSNISGQYDAASGLAGVPAANDNLVQLGCRNASYPNRQCAIILSAVSNDSPSTKYYHGINSFSLNGLVKDEGYDSSNGVFHVNVYGDFYFGQSGNAPTKYIEYDSTNNTLTISAQVNLLSGSTLVGNSLETLLSNLEQEAETLAALINATSQIAEDAYDTVSGMQTIVGGLQQDVTDINGSITNLSTGNENLVVNGGFTGVYESESVESNLTVNTGTAIYSDPWGYWDTHTGCTDIVSNTSATGKACRMASGRLVQTIGRGIKSLQDYTFSLLALSSGSITISVGGVSKSLTLSAGARVNTTIKTSDTSSRLIIEGSGDITEILLIQGNITINDWIPSPIDNNKYLGYYKNMAYLLHAIGEASTTILGGLVLTEAIHVGQYTDDVMTQETGGMNGNATNNNSPFLWGGGTMTQAINTITAYLSDPTHTPTNDEAKFVVTHGGRAILTDIILRGYIYAEGGILKSVQSKNGNWSLDEQGNMTCQDATIKGNQYTPMFRLTAENYATVINNFLTINPQIDLTKTGLNVVVESLPSGASRRVFLPQQGEEWNGARFHIVNNCPQAAAIGFLVGPFREWRQNPDTGEVYKESDFNVINVYLGGSATFVAVLQENGVDIEWHLLSLTDGLHYVHPE